MLKWKLMLTTLPYVVVVVGIKVVLEYVAKIPGFVEFGDVGIVLTAGVFLTGFMLAGTMADYKESEKLPGDLACTLETLEETLVQASVLKPTILVPPIREVILATSKQLRGWLLRTVSHQGAFDAITGLTVLCQQVEKDGGAGYAGKAIGEVHNLRKTVTRIGVISRTGFLPPAYAVLETLTVIIVVLLLASKFKTALAEFILVPFVTLIYVYMIRLIKDIDDPFDYAPDGSKRGGAEVELFPLDEYLERLQKRLG